MVRRGSTVRVRQRALKKRRNCRFSCPARLQDVQYAVRVEPFMEPPGSERTVQSVGNGAFAGRLVCIQPPRPAGPRRRSVASTAPGGTARRGCARMRVTRASERYSCRAALRAENASPKKSAANTRKTVPMPESSRVKSTTAMIRNKIPASALPRACFDTDPGDLVIAPGRRRGELLEQAARLGRRALPLEVT